MSSNMRKVHCPFCQKIPTGTCELVPGTALLEEVEDGMEYVGETRMHEDGQKTEKDDRGLTVFWCDACDKEFACDPF